MKVPAPFPMVRFLGWRIGIDAATLDTGWKFSVIYLPGLADA
jgi:hypothetical protein